MKTKIYKGYEITKTNTTTDSQRCVYGTWYNCIEYVHSIDGVHGYWTSFAGAKRWINEKIKNDKEENDPEYIAWNKEQRAKEDTEIEKERIQNVKYW